MLGPRSRPGLPGAPHPRELSGRAHALTGGPQDRLPRREEAETPARRSVREGAAGRGEKGPRLGPNVPDARGVPAPQLEPAGRRAWGALPGPLPGAPLSTSAAAGRTPGACSLQCSVSGFGSVLNRAGRACTWEDPRRPERVCAQHPGTP